jgi:hypothetical protein
MQISQISTKKKNPPTMLWKNKSNKLQVKQQEF